MTRRTGIFVLVGAILGVAFGLVYVLLFDPLCGCEGIPEQCSCPLAVPVWTAIGIAGGGLVGLVAARATRRTSDMPTIRPMSARVRWVVLGVVLLLVLGLAALYWFNANLAGVTLEESDGQRTWNVQSGGAVKLSADDVRPSDRYTCDEIGVRSVDAPSPGRQIARQGVKGVISVETAEDGDVTITCERGVALPGT